MVEFLVYKRTDSECHDRIAYRKKCILNRGYLIVKNYYSEILNINVNGVDEEKSLEVTEGVRSIEYRGHIHKEHCKYTPKILHIAEENEERGEDKTDSDIENDKAGDRNYKKEKSPREGYSLENAEDEENDKGKTEIDKRGNIS